ncbi:arylamine N-acetyltransferase family protein [Longirhabdus pacifica]|uniref:arylamine N-acetyltransferase family protein n=1 Tax=Longirhabdus pacifica TaxID=2305227 RepID=UPI0010086F1E|nr:arylamine N-acetyltransferase [Longirhabdus pacifica]
MNVEQYLNRINVNTLHDDPYTNLVHLLKQHVFTVPFENLDVIRKVPITLDLQRIYEKIVHRHRGGFCYEINGLFHWLLKELGYNVKRIAATVKKNKSEWYKDHTHLSNIVTLNQKEYVVDAGERYKVTKMNDMIYYVQRYDEEEKEWLTSYKFTTEEIEFLFFEDMCKWNQSPASPFTQKLIVTLSNEHGRVSLTGKEIITTIKWLEN